MQTLNDWYKNAKSVREKQKKNSVSSFLIMNMLDQQNIFNVSPITKYKYMN